MTTQTFSGINSRVQYKRTDYETLTHIISCKDPHGKGLALATRLQTYLKLPCTPCSLKSAPSPDALHIKVI